LELLTVKIVQQHFLINLHIEKIRKPMNETEKLKNLVLAPYIIKATALIGKQRSVGGNQFRHALATMAILLDYKLFDDYVLLKASVIHDLLEDVPETNEQELRCIDSQANQVVDLVLEVTRPCDMNKIDFLKRILEKGSRNAKILKVADRISNVTDLHRDQYSRQKMCDYLNQTEKYVLPMAQEVNKDMVIELKDLISRRRKQMNFLDYSGLLGLLRFRIKYGKQKKTPNPI
jgi:(p)ppGpp synthase/HD superfamily hydrolase